MSAADSSEKKLRLLFVCMGNICRSPAAEGVMKYLVRARSLSDRIEIQSAGTIGYHAGEPADSRMREAAARRGYKLESLAQHLTNQHLEQFDYVLVMDEDNLLGVRRLDPMKLHQGKVRFLTDFCKDQSCKEVPDPYYGGPSGFERVLDIIEDACANLLDHIVREHKLR